MAHVSSPHPRRSTLALVLACGLWLAGTAAAQVGAGDRLVDEGRFEEAVAAYEAAVAANPEDARAHYQLARASVYLADALPADAAADKEAWFARAADAAELAVGLAPADPDAHFEVARALGRLAQFRGVLQSLNLAGRVSRALDAALELDPEHAASWHARALFHRDVPWIAGGRAGQVISSFQRAIASEPDVITHRLELARVLIGRDDPAAAREQLEAAVTFPARTYHDRLDLEAARELLASLR
ncbi:MAG: tetratricopeptide repeat protein [Trueperaceae bacterium]|nr:tetratricopeptide repeat protein [Trueperaceae bacterium]